MRSIGFGIAHGLGQAKDRLNAFPYRVPVIVIAAIPKDSRYRNHLIFERGQLRRLKVSSTLSIVLLQSARDHHSPLQGFAEPDRLLDIHAIRREQRHGTRDKGLVQIGD